jgi:hypothetical protein
MQKNIHENEATRPASAQVDADDQIPFATRASTIALTILVSWLLVGVFGRFLR